MTGKGHFATGVCFSLFSYKFNMELLSNSSFIFPMACAIGTIIGSTAPDWLEIVKKNGGRVIKHRTITHWVLLWFLFFSVCYFQLTNNFLINNLPYDNVTKLGFSFGLGFSIGGLLHLLYDLPNPMGIPLITPYRRISLNLWKSGKNEFFIITITLIFSLYYIKIIDINFQNIKNLFI